MESSKASPLEQPPTSSPKKDDAAPQPVSDKAAHRAKLAAAKAAVREKARLRDKVMAMLKKHVGERARDIQRDKMLMELLIKMAADSKAEVDEEIAQKAALQAKVDHMEQTVYKALEASQNEVAELKRKVQEMEMAMYNAAYAYEQAQVEHAEMHGSLRFAEDAAAAATAECQHLAAAVLALTEQEARSRRSLAHRAHNLRSALTGASAKLREFNELDRKNRIEAEWKLRQRERTLEAERQQLLDEQAAQQERDQILESTQLRFFLAQQEIERLKQQGQQADVAGSPAAAAAAAGDVVSKAKGGNSSAATTMQQKLLAGSKKQARVSSARQSLADGDFVIKAKH